MKPKASKKKDKVYVQISAQETVRYSQRREIPKAVFNEYERLCKAGIASDDNVNRILEIYVDPADVIDSDGIEDLTIVRIKAADARKAGKK